MATKNSTSTSERADHLGDTAPLPPAAEAALHRALLAFDPQARMSEADRLAHEAASYVRRPVQPVAADDHGKAKEPLPPRPRGPHPYRTAVA